jgi:LPS sulfotransferase NodH
VTPLAPSFVTVVAGAPRSGTSLMMQMLGAGGLELLTDGRRRADLDNPRGYFELEAARRLPRVAGWLEGASGRAVKLVHVLVPRLPEGREYRVLLMRRDGREVVASQRAMLERRGGAPEGPDDERLARIFAAQLDEVERWAAASAGVALLRVDYNRLVREPLAVAREVCAFLGCGLDADDMAAAVLPALYRQRAGAPAQPFATGSFR